MRFWIMAGVAFALFTASAHADPVHLECAVAEADGRSPVTFEVTVDETRGVASLRIRETGFSILQTPAMFTVRDVSFVNARERSSTAYRIDRTSLEMTEVIERDPGMRTSRSGLCVIPQPGQRQF
jgi:hypothetical protein